MKSFRPERVANVIRAVVSDAIANRLNDPRIVPLSSVTRVEVTADLEHAKVYVSVMGTPGEQKRTIAGLKSAVGFVQKLVAQELKIRTCPHLGFQLDESIKKGDETIRLIDQVMAESRAHSNLGDAPAEQDTSDEQDERESDVDGESDQSSRATT